MSVITITAHPVNRLWWVEGVQSPASILAYYLCEVLGVMSVPDDEAAWPLFISFMPDTEQSETCGVVYDVGGNLSGHLSRGGVLEKPGVQIKVRSEDYQDGWQKIIDICANLDEIKYKTVVISDRSYKIYNITRVSNILYIGQDEQRRFLFTASMTVSLKMITV